jgi:hypothetical protein
MPNQRPGSITPTQVGTKTTAQTIAYYYKWKKLENSRYRYLLAHQRRGGSVALDPAIYQHADELDIDAEADLNAKVQCGKKKVAV